MITRIYKLTRKYKTDRIPKVVKFVDGITDETLALNPKGINRVGLIFEQLDMANQRIIRPINGIIESSLEQMIRKKNGSE